MKYKYRYFLDLLGFYVCDIFLSKDLIPTFRISDTHKLLFILRFVKSHYCFKCRLLIDLCVTDYLNFLCKYTKFRKERFQITYNVYSLCYKFRIFFNLLIGDQVGVSSISTIFFNGAWLERESWDLFGILYEGHPNLRRLLTDYGFKGFPFRKDFPLCGFLELSYDDENKTLEYTPVELSQDYRHFSFKMVWK